MLGSQPLSLPPLIALVLLVAPSHSVPSTTTTTTPSTDPAYTRRPFYNIGHMVNSLQEIDSFLAKGANGIETDVYFASNATPVYSFHGYPCDCFRFCDERERISVFLNRVRELSSPTKVSYNPRLLLLFLDLKLMRIPHSARALAGQNLAKMLLQQLYDQNEQHSADRGSTVSTLVSITHVFDYDVILGFQNEFEKQGKGWLLQQHIGFDVGMNDPLLIIESMWKRFDSISNVWQGDGRSNCMSPFYNLARLSSVVKRRNKPSMFGVKNYIRKAYQWTVDLSVNMRTALRSDVDAIVTNHPERLVHVIEEAEFSPSFRLADLTDSPWTRVLRPTPRRPATLAPLQDPSLGLKLVNGAGDMADSLAKYVADMLVHRSPLRYLFFALFSAFQNQRRSDSSLASQPNSPAPTDHSAQTEPHSGPLLGTLLHHLLWLVKWLL